MANAEIVAFAKTLGVNSIRWFDAIRMCKAICAITLKGESVEEAMKLYDSTILGNVRP